MKVDDAIRKAVKNNDHNLAGVVADHLRMHGFGYWKIAKRFEDVAGCNAEDFENLMYLADSLD